LAALLRRRNLVLAAFAGIVAVAGVGASTVGRDFFPVVDAGQIRMHITAPPGTRIEETERYFAQIEAAVAQLIPASQRETLISQIGLPASYTIAVTDTANVSSADGELLVRLRSDHATPTANFVARLRAELPRRFPELRFYFQPADMVTQVLNFGLPAPIDIQISGSQQDKTLAIARGIEADLKKVPGLVDVRLHQIVDAPRLHLEVDRTRALQVGLSQRDIASNVLLSVGSSGTVAPNYWTDPKTGVGYPVVVQVPQVAVRTLDELLSLPLSSESGMQQLRDVLSVTRLTTPAFTTRVDVQPTFNVRADVAGTDLASVASRIDDIVGAHRAQLPPGGKITVRGQIESMRSAFGRLGIGIAFAAFLVFCLLVMNFQSWSAPLMILAALPGAAGGIVLSLLVTGTTLNVPSLMGAIMSIGVATANSILVIAFADERRRSGATAVRAALDAGEARLRPVVMTALAMVIGMLPMALNLSEGGEQNAALARAVIGGLAGATPTTLFIVPVLFAVVRRRDRVVAQDPDLVA
jgi:multidrug efflux pump subunit AcrB